MHNVKQVKQGGCPRNPLTPAWHRRRPNLPVAPALPATLRWPELDHSSPSHGRPLGVSGARCAHMWPGWVPAAGDGASAGPGSDRSDVQEQLEQLAGEEAQPSFGNLPLELRLKCLASCDWQTLSRAACVSRSARALVSGRAQVPAAARPASAVTYPTHRRRARLPAFLRSAVHGTRTL